MNPGTSDLVVRSYQPIYVNPTEIKWRTVIETLAVDSQDPPVFLYEGWGRTEQESRREALSGYRSFLRRASKQIKALWWGTDDG